ncbi:MAG TPA: hypothetical protein VFA99_07865 [Acidobacteriaceae bacterium]|nr:hypothetical protein [Acidobacteriaceae bacterium]
MDVHPPQHPLHTWSDFWIHLGTISIGLVIALGLEATAQWMHRVHRTHILEAALHAETQRNDLYIGNGILAARYTSSQLQQQLFRAEAALPGAKNTASPPPLAPAPPDTGTSPDTAVWDSARQSASIALLPDDLAQQYSDNYAEAEFCQQMFRKAAERLEAVRAFRRTIPNQPLTGEPDLRTFSPDQLRDYISLQAAAIESLLSAASNLQFYRVHNLCILQGARTSDAMASCLRNNYPKR